MDILKVASTARVAPASLILALALAPAQANAQVTGSLPVQIFTPGEPTTGGFNQLLDTQTLGHLRPGVGLTFNYAHKPLEVVNRTSGESVDLVMGHAQADVMAALGLGARLQVGLAIPVTPFITSGEDGFVEAPEVSGAGLGDVRVSALYRLLGDGSGFDLALAAIVAIPTGDASRYLGAGGLTIEPRLVASLSPMEALGLSVNLGYTVRTAEQGIAVYGTDVIGIGNELSYGVGARFGVMPDLDLLAELYGRVGMDGAVLNDGSDRPLELDVAVRKRLGGGDHALTVGAGTGLIAGYGAPLVRGFVGYAWAPQADGDTDGDGINDRIDACPEEPEDRDDFQDDDGCPDPDNDSDGIADGADACPNKKEDGRAPDTEDGCPVGDTDGDGLPDDKDTCPREPEDKDGFEDGDGCPDVDNDKDGILDANDACPMEAEVINGVDDEDGCPDEGASAVKVTDSHIEITEMVYFKTNSDELEQRSENVLNQVASTLRANPQISRIEVEGHTDDVSADYYNLDLSTRRAKAVRTYLIQRGVSAERLTAVGYGETKPIKPGTSKAARAANRRVEFRILEIDGAPLN